MKAILPVLDPTRSMPLYLQLYHYIRESILSGEIREGEKLPSLRSLASSLALSLTTISATYEQLEVEGYITSRPQSGYYVRRIPSVFSGIDGMPPQNPYSRRSSESVNSKPANGESVQPAPFPESPGRIEAAAPTPAMPSAASATSPATPSATPFLYDLACFDFTKWKKCMSQVFTEHADQLMFESDPQGELSLRQELSRYLYSARGVFCDPSQIVIGAGTQQIAGSLSLILAHNGIRHAVVEDPGYLPVRNILRDRGFAVTPVAVDENGIRIEKLPINIRTAAYINPGNQFPTGAVTPIGNRYRLLSWALANDSFIIEDDYDSELRYTGRPIPPLKSLDTANRVIYLGSFSSTLFASVKISYMVLPEPLSEIFHEIKNDYTQTCSKAEQLTLAAFMQRGLYQINIKKLRTLYAQKLQHLLASVHRYGAGFITPLNTASGINITLRISSGKTPETLAAEAASLGIRVLPVDFPAAQSGIGDGWSSAESGVEDGIWDGAESGARDDAANAHHRGNAPSTLPSSKKQSAAEPMLDSTFILYYHQIPIEKIEPLMQILFQTWQCEARESN